MASLSEEEFAEAIPLFCAITEHSFGWRVIRRGRQIIAEANVHPPESLPQDGFCSNVQGRFEHGDENSSEEDLIEEDDSSNGTNSTFHAAEAGKLSTVQVCIAYDSARQAAQLLFREQTEDGVDLLLQRIQTLQTKQKPQQKAMPSAEQLQEVELPCEITPSLFINGASSGIPPQFVVPEPHPFSQHAWWTVHPCQVAAFASKLGQSVAQPSAVEIAQQASQPQQIQEPAILKVAKWIAIVGPIVGVHLSLKEMADCCAAS